jgi:hypothetical protein
MVKFNFALLSPGFILLTAVAARGQNLFDLTATSTTSTITAGGNNVLNLVQNLTNNTAQFIPLQNQTFSSTLDYAGIANAIKVNQSFDSSGNRIITLQVPSVGVNQTFSSANGGVSSQIRNYLEHSGLADLTKFQAVVSQTSPAGVIDGNPLAATAMLQDSGFSEFGLHQSPLLINGQQFSSDNGVVVSRYSADGGVLDAGGVSGQYVDLNVGTDIHYNDILGLTFTTPLRYEKLRSADVYMGGEIVGLPITVLPGREGPLNWTITPAGHAGIAGSQDLVSGGIMYGGQVTSSFSITIHGFTLTMANQAGYYHGADIDIAGYDFNTPLNQWIYKNGLQLTKSFGSFFIDASGTWTDFSHDVYVKSYFTPQLGLGFKFGRDGDSGLRVGYSGSFGSNYNTNGGNVLLYFNW